MSAANLDRLDQLYRAEFGARNEVRLRIVILTLLVLPLWVITGDVVFVVWLCAYFACVCLFWIYTRRSRRPDVSTARLYLAFVLHTGTLCAFLVLPLYMLVQDDMLLIFSGNAALIGLIVYIMQREDPGTDVLRIEAVGLSFALIVILWHVLPQYNSVGGQLGGTAVALGLFVYFMSAAHHQRKSFLARRAAERRYAQAQRARALGQFVGGVAHDFNNQLTAIKGHLELFEMLDDPAERQNALRQSREAADRAAHTVRQLLASSGRTRLSPKPLPLIDFFEEIPPLLQRVCAPDMIIRVEPAPQALTALVDRDMLETCLIQLCLNAQEAVDGKGTITIYGRLEPSDTDLEPKPETSPPYISICVVDDGPGVAPDVLAVMAEPFYTTKDVGQGPGLGLSTVAGFARQSGGGFKLHSTPNNGLTACILLPRADLSDQVSGS